MTVWKAALVALLSVSSSTAFVPASTSSVSFSHDSSSTALRLTSEEILARSRQAAGQPPAQDSLPLVFDDDILADMQAALLTLEKRVQEGPGSLEETELDELTAQLDRIVAEMHANPHRRHQKPVRTAAEPGAPVAAAPQAPPPSSPQGAAAATSAPPQTAAPAPTNAADDQDEGPAYDGTGGMGQPRGTVNTYIIEGMEEMTSEEYRLALQQSIIDRQRARRAQGNVGNRGSLDYLHSLSPNGTDSQRREGSVQPDVRGPKDWSGWGN